jgi:hypothetical protein
MALTLVYWLRWIQFHIATPTLTHSVAANHDTPLVLEQTHGEANDGPGKGRDPLEPWDITVFYGLRHWSELGIELASVLIREVPIEVVNAVVPASHDNGVQSGARLDGWQCLSE